MPSGMTAAIYEGQDVSLRDYLMTVGRGMGYAILQRDDAPDEPVTRVEPNTKYHDEAIERSEARESEVRKWSREESERQARAAFDEAFRNWLSTRNEKAELRRRYESMIEQVEAWTPDPLVASTKENALKYLRESIDFDCGSDGDDMRWHPEPELVAGEEFQRQELERAQRDVKYHTAERIKEIARADERNSYIDAFLNSLPAVAA